MKTTQQQKKQLRFASDPERRNKNRLNTTASTVGLHNCGKIQIGVVAKTNTQCFYCQERARGARRDAEPGEEEEEGHNMRAFQDPQHKARRT